MKKQALETRDKGAAERYWDRLRAEGSLRAAFDRQAAQIPEPDWEAVYRSADAPQIHRGLPPWSLFLGAAAACFVVAVWWVAPSVLGKHELASASVVEQVFQSTAGGETWEAGAEKNNSASFSSILKTIDAGISHWDEAPPLEE